MPFFTADICDAHREAVQVLSHDFRDYGGVEKFRGPIATIRLDEENSGLIAMLKEPGKGRVAVVDVGAVFYAVVGENLMKLASENGWAGLIVNGFVRDTHMTRTIPVGLWALGACARKSHEKRASLRDVPLEFGGVRFANGEYLVADRDGVIVIDGSLLDR
jgi:regulator of ribonuclease activity A